MSVYSSLYCYTATVLSGILDHFPSGNSVLLAPSLQDEVFTDQITGDIYTCDKANKLSLSMGDIDWDTTEDNNNFLKDEDKSGWKSLLSAGYTKWPTNSPLLYIGWRTMW